MRRRSFNAFSLSFLDVMFCGFGAVILFFMIINADTQARRQETHLTAQGEAEQLETEVLEAERYSVQIRNSLQELDERLVQARGRSAEIIEDLDTRNVRLAQMQQETLAKLEHIDALKADLKSLEQDRLRLEAGAKQAPVHGERLRQFVGQGQRQYLTGLKMGGERILILVDSSASMLADRIINVLRFRNLPPGERVRAAKWQQVLHTVNWITTRIPPQSQFQIYTFNETSAPVYAVPEIDWLDGGDARHLDAAVDALHEIAPENGTSLYRAFKGIGKLSPPPDTVYLLTDGLPTQGKSRPLGSKVSAKTRKKLFTTALEVLPDGIPVNIILFNMEGDPEASSEYWKLARNTRGSFFSPSRDWP